MATLHIDKIIAEKVNQDDLIRLLETVIDEEMQRPDAEMNCDLIDQCVDALLEMRQDRDHLPVMVPLMQDKAFLHLIQRKAGNTARLNGAGAYHRKRRNRYPSTGANHHGDCRHATQHDHAHHHGPGAGEPHQERTDHQESDR